MAKERWRGRGLDADWESRGPWVSSPAHLRHVKLRKAWLVLEPQLPLEKTPTHTALGWRELSGDCGFQG